MKRSFRGFTLIETLVTIAIIAILISILIPSLLYIRRQAKKTSLLTQVNKLNQAMQQYTSEYGGSPGVYTHEELIDVSQDITMTENVFFSLMGGPVFSNGEPPDVATLGTDVQNEDGGSSYDVAMMGTGPIYKDDSNAWRRQSSFFRGSKGEFQNVTGTMGSDNYIPDMVDPVNGQPILIYTAAPYPKDESGYARGDRAVVAVSYDNNAVTGDREYYGLVWRRLNDDFVSSEGLSSGGQVIDQRNNSLISDFCVMNGGTDYGQNSNVGASSNLAWYINNWSDSKNSFGGNPNYIPQYGRHAVDHGYWIISPGYDGIYLNKEGNHSRTTSIDYSYGSDDWDSKYTKYSDYDQERQHWFDTMDSDRLIMAHRFYDGTSQGESLYGRDQSFTSPEEGKNGGKDPHFNQYILEPLQQNWDDIIISGGELDSSVE